MTENSKIFLTKRSILNIFAENEFSIGLSLYIIKDILKLLELMYNEVVLKLLSKLKDILLDNLLQNIKTFDTEVYPIKWEPSEENNLNTSDQAD